MYYLAKFFLAFSNEVIIAPLIIIGFLGLDRKVYGHALTLLLFTMLFNKILKQYFAIPLNPSLNIEGFAFPSGHAQSSIVFYGCLYVAFSRVMKILIILLLTGISLSLIYLGYHNSYDILGAAVFGILTIGFFYYLLKLEIFQNRPYSLGIYLILISMCLIFYYSRKYTVPNHMWMPFYVLVGFTLSWAIFYKDTVQLTNFINRIVSIGISFTIVGFIYYILPVLKNFLPTYLQLEWVIVGMIIPMSVRISRFSCKDNNLT